MASKQGGFTIVELLIAIVIIGIVLVLTLPNLFNVQRRARDDTRKNDLRNIQQSLETYHNDQVSYPTTAEGLAVLAPSYINEVPNDPNGAAYGYESDAPSYTLTADLENDNDQDADGNGNYVITSVNQ
jgi:general secretion pathway protein G